MAARTRKLIHDEETRARIKTSQLVNRLQDYIDGKIQLEPAQVNAVAILLRKTLPDLTSTELIGGGDINIVIHGGLPQASAQVVKLQPLKLIEGSKV